MLWYFCVQLLEAIDGCFVVVAIGGIVDHNGRYVLMLVNVK